MKQRAYSCLLPYRADGKILLQHRTDDAKSNPSYWACFGGGVEAGETPEQALARELLEEIEYSVTLPPVLFLTQAYMQRGEHITSYEFIEKFDDTQPIVLHEGQGYGWYTPDEALTLKITERRRITFLKLQQLLPGLINNYQTARI